MAARKKSRTSARKKRAAYSKSPRTIYKDGKTSIQVVIRKKATTKRKRTKK
jgi:ribosomal protein L25 (general stress protein Ctc)